jgi:2,5-dichlorohydroquinone reductive dechlorinase
MSLCSQKVRATLVQKNAAFESNEMLIIGSRDEAGRLTPAENYAPDYVRLRLLGGKSGEFGLASSYSGMSSVSAAGLDACAVPTLVDLVEARVIVDSVLICEHIGKALPGASSLLPADPDGLAIMRRQLDAVDITPHPGLLYRFHPENDSRPELLRQAMLSVYDDKAEALERLVAENSTDSELVAAYKAKMSKEAGGKAVRFNREFQEFNLSRAREVLANLENDLAGMKADWLCGPDVSLADLFWAVSLVRLTYLGLSWLWSDLPSVEGYYSKLISLPSVRQEVIKATIERMPPSKYLTLH